MSTGLSRQNEGLMESENSVNLFGRFLGIILVYAHGSELPRLVDRGTYFAKYPAYDCVLTQAEVTF